jgi:hypothetical protein
VSCWATRSCSSLKQIDATLLARSSSGAGGCCKCWCCCCSPAGCRCSCCASCPWLPTACPPSPAASAAAGGAGAGAGGAGVRQAGRKGPSGCRSRFAIVCATQAVVTKATPRGRRSSTPPFTLTSSAGLRGRGEGRRAGRKGCLAC